MCAAETAGDFDAGKNAQALTEAEISNRMLKEQSEGDTGNVSLELEHAISYATIGSVLKRLGRKKQARERSQEALRR